MAIKALEDTRAQRVRVVVERRKLQGESFERIRSCMKRGPAFYRQFIHMFSPYLARNARTVGRHKNSIIVVQTEICPGYSY